MILTFAHFCQAQQNVNLPTKNQEKKKKEKSDSTIHNENCDCIVRFHSLDYLLTIFPFDVTVI